MPLGARSFYSELAKRASGQITGADIAKFLPNSSSAQGQLLILALLAGYRFDKLGDYEKSFKSLFNLSVLEVFEEYNIVDFSKYIDCNDLFKGELKRVEIEITKRNKHRKSKGWAEYPYMLPSKIVNSISI